MITRQHVACYVMALATKFSSKNALDQQLLKTIPYVLLPDAIRSYIGQRQPSHFECTPYSKSVSWIEFPTPKVLKNLSKETFSEQVNYYLAHGYPKCVIGEDTLISKFDIKNHNHPYYNIIRIHLLQDKCFDDMLRNNLVDCTHRFNNQFIVNHNRNIILDGQVLREQINLYEEYGFIHLVNKVFKFTGILLDGDWFDKYVLTSLLEAYPEDLALNTYKYIKFSDTLNQRIKHHELKLSQEEIDSIFIAEDVIQSLNDLYSEAIHLTYQEL